MYKDANNSFLRSRRSVRQEFASLETPGQVGHLSCLRCTLESVSASQLPPLPFFRIVSSYKRRATANLLGNFRASFFFDVRSLETPCRGNTLSSRGSLVLVVYSINSLQHSLIFHSNFLTKNYLKKTEKKKSEAVLK